MRALLFLGVVGAALVACTGDDTAAPIDAGADVTVEAGPQTLADRGKAFVVARKCASCHETPDMPGVLAGSASPIPGTGAYASNLTPDPDTGIDGWSDQELIAALKNGVDDRGDALCPPMPHYGDMADDEAKAISAYLRSLPPVHHYVPDSDCPEKHASDAGADADAAAADAASDGAGEGGASDAGADAISDAPNGG